MKINVGDYVRTKWGIARLTDITTYPCNPFKYEIEEGDATFTVYYIDTCFIPIDETRICKEDIIKSSPNIIELIEVGDYVNGIKVDEIKNGHLLNYNAYDDYQVCIVSNNEDIKSILTREQFESMKYEVK